MRLLRLLMCVCELSDATQPRRVRDNSFIIKTRTAGRLAPPCRRFPSHIVGPPFGARLIERFDHLNENQAETILKLMHSVQRDVNWSFVAENTLLFQRFQQLYLIRTHLVEVVSICFHFYLFSSAKNCPIRRMEWQVESSNDIETWNKEKLAFGEFPLDRADEIRRAPLLLVSFFRPESLTDISSFKKNENVRTTNEK